jgi:hypothetical protein
MTSLMKSNAASILFTVLLLGLPDAGRASVIDGPVDVTQPPYNAKGDGTTDDTAAINGALSSGHTVYLPATTACYRTTAALVMSVHEQLMYGDGGTRSSICVSSAFDGGVIKFTSGEPGPQLRDLGIIFTQPDNASRSAMNHYQPAIYARNTARFKIQRMRISRAWDGIDMTGNSGGVVIDDLEVSAFDKAIWVDGSLDTVRLNQVHVWSFDLTATQVQAFREADAVGFYIGRCDDCEIANAVMLSGTGMKFFAGADGAAPFALISNTGFDTYNGLSMSAGTIQMSSVYFTLLPSATVQAINMTGGNLNISSFWMLGGPTSLPMIQVSGGVSLNLSNGNIQLADRDITFLSSLSKGEPGHIGLSNNYFDVYPNVVHDRPLISIGGKPGIRVQALGNQVRDKGAGAGTFLSIDYDDFHRIIGNTSIGWTNNFPAAVKGVYQNN